ncbi:hypothetical protein FDP41_007655 [Naegleria fowleri]|uniref:ATPase AAA-type core domain-containing protein n=1 Tax=Naegleria fowleri TaxID=5763 RepID=A0A6A5CDU3_NAEFO|nr:uncharacterized protein FDP41_007655 [Naegleria fowleri]KAF0983740.1 hypothetical protein FDP41_007655 [Naegleria fowleri]
MIIQQQPHASSKATTRTETSSSDMLPSDPIRKGWKDTQPQRKIVKISSSSEHDDLSTTPTTDVNNSNTSSSPSQAPSLQQGPIGQVFQSLREKVSTLLFNHQYWNLFSQASSSSSTDKSKMHENESHIQFIGQIRPPFIIERFDKPQVNNNGKKMIVRKIVPLLQLENYLNKCLVNQEIAIKTICYCLLRQSTIWSYSYHQLSSSSENSEQTQDELQKKQFMKKTKIPLSLFFIGPLGVGKLYISRLIAQSQGRPFVLFDMNYFTEEESLSNLVQFSDEYRYNQPFNYMLGQLNVVLETAPNAVIVFNNMEYAHPSIFRFLHQLFRAGLILEQKSRKDVNYKAQHSGSLATDQSLESSANKRTDKKKATADIKKPLEEELVRVIDASQAIFICISVISDQMVKKNILENGPNTLIDKYEQEKKSVQNNNYQSQSSYSASQFPYEDTYLNNDENEFSTLQFKPMKKQSQLRKPSTLTDRASTLNSTTTNSTTGYLEQVSSAYSAIDALDRVIEFRHHITPFLVDHLNNSNKSEENKMPKCFDAFLHQFNAIVPFFAFSDVELCHQIITQLSTFSSFANSQKCYKLTWSEDVVIWLMKRYRPSLTVTGVLENHVLTPLAAADHLFSPHDHIHLEVSPELDRISITVLNRRDDTQLRRDLSLIQSKL